MRFQLEVLFVPHLLLPRLKSRIFAFTVDDRVYFIQFSKSLNACVVAAFSADVLGSENGIKKDDIWK